MRLVNAQRQLRERGRIRIGYSTTNERGKKVPHRLDTFRFTTPDEQTIGEVAAVYGGTPEPWPDGGRDRFQVVSEVDSINVILPAGMAMSQAYEQYKGGFPVLRCDGETCWTPSDRKLDVKPCTCDPERPECDLTTMVNVILADLLGMGVFRLVTHSYYGARELAASVDMIESAMAVGARVPTRLFITHREVRRLVNGKPQVRKFPVPVLDLNMSVAALGSGGSGAVLSLLEPQGDLPSPPESAAPALPAAWRPVNQQALPPAPLPDVRAVLAENERPPRQRANAAPPIPATGVKARGEAEHAAAMKTCSLCGLEYGQATLVRNPEPGGSRFVHAHCLPAPEEGDSPAVQPPPEDEPARDGGGAAGTGEASAGTQPAPVTDPQDDRKGRGYVRMMTSRQHSKAMALCAEVWPAGELSGRDADDMRRENLLHLAAVLGQPGLTSRSQITATTAPILLDALEQLKAGTVGLTAAGLVDAATGEVTVRAPEPAP